MEQFKIYSHFADFGQVKIDLTCFILLTLGITVILPSLSKTLHREKQSKPTPFDKKLKNGAQDLAQVIFNDLISRNQELGSLVNK